MKLTKEQQKKLLLQPSPEFRVSHPKLFKPDAMKKGDKESYSIEMLYDKETTDLKTLQAPLQAARAFKWGANKDEWPSPLHWPIKDGDKPKMNKQTRKMEVKPEHKGMWVVKASSSAEYNRPQVVGKDPSKVIESEGELYPGCYARAGLKAHAYEFADKNGVKYILDAVQFIRDGAAFGGRKKATEIFGTIEDDGDDTGLTGNEDLENFEAETNEAQESFL